MNAFENDAAPPDSNDFDVVIIGSGFGGSVPALRLTEKGYRVAVLEAGRRFRDQDFPENSWHLRSFLFAPALRCFGIFRMSLVRNAFILSGAGVGGGSLVYAQTLYVPGEPFYKGAQWGHITDWQSELAPFYDQAKRMLGVTENPTVTPSDEAMLQLAREMGVEHTFRKTPVGVYFGQPGVEAADPYFGGVGPRRTGCIEHGECMTGCRHNAKNTLVKNYLHLAERGGAKIFPLTTVTTIRCLPNGKYAVDTVRTNAILRKHRRTFTARNVIVAAATLGTQRLLHRMRDEGHLPKLSDRLGELTRTNSEAILGARTFRKGVDFTKGVAITSSFYPEKDTHVEPVRYGRNSNALGVLATALADAGPQSRRLAWCKEFFSNFGSMCRAMVLRHWSEQTIIALVMQSRDNSLTCYTKRGLFGRRLTSKQGVGDPNPEWIPVAHEAVRRLAKIIRGVPFGTFSDLFGIPTTAHFLGGCVIGDSVETGVIDPYHRVYNYPGLHITDGSAVSANPGVNPSLTITAQAERAMSFWPNKGDPDPRPALGDPYVRISPMYPKSPIVPAGAPAELRLTV